MTTITFKRVTRITGGDFDARRPEGSKVRIREWRFKRGDKIRISDVLYYHVLGKRRGIYFTFRRHRCYMDLVNSYFTVTH